MPWYFYLALKQLFPSGKRFPFFTAVSVVSVALGVALLVVVLGVMGGFGAEVKKMIVETQGDVQLRAQGRFIDDPQATLAQVEKVDGVAAATPFAEGFVMLLHESRPAFPVIQGIDPTRVENVVPLRKYIRVGSLDDLDDDSVIISSILAQSIGAHIGSKIEVGSLLMLEKMKRDELLLPRELRVVGIFEVGHQQLDSSTLICTLRLMQELYGLGNSVHGINIRLKPGKNVNEMVALLNRSFPPEQSLVARAWYEIQADFLWILNFEKSMMMFIVLFVVIVAAFLTTSLLTVLVIKKTREIGLLNALGAGKKEIALCFCVQGFLIGVVGTAIGLAGGLGLLAMRNEIVNFLMGITGKQEVLVKFYQFSQLPAHSETGDLVTIIVAAIVLSTMAGLIPAIKAARLKPVDALRTE